MKIEELRPMQGFYNPDIIPVVVLLRALWDSPACTMQICRANEILADFKKDFCKDLKYLESYGVVKCHYIDDEIQVVSMERKEYDEYYDLNLIENCKIILKNLEEPVLMYELAKLFIMRYPVEDLPYIIDLLEYEGIIGAVNV